MAADLDYSKLNRKQKLAVFLIVIGPDAAAELFRQFDDAEVEQLCREMSALSVIPHAVQRSALDEFSGILAQSASSTLGGVAYAQRTIEIARGDQKASSIMDRVGTGGAPSDVIKELSEMEGRQIYNLIRNEQPQTISFVLSHIDGAKSSEVFAMLSPELREEVIERLGTIESTSRDLVGKIARSLGKHFDTKARPTFQRSGGVRFVADLLNRLDKETSKTLVARLEERNAGLSAAVRKQLFGFGDLVRLQASDLQRVLREVDSSNLAVSMKAASDGLRERIFGSISKRAAESLKEEIDMLGNVRRKDIDAAQDAVILVVRRLEDEGQISLDSEAA